MINRFTSSVGTTRSRTRVATLLIDTSKVESALGAYCTFGSASWWAAYEFG